MMNKQLKNVNDLRNALNLKDAQQKENLNKAKYEKVQNEVMESVKKVFENNGFNGDVLDRMLDEVKYGLFSDGLNLESGLMEYFE